MKLTKEKLQIYPNCLNGNFDDEDQSKYDMRWSEFNIDEHIKKYICYCEAMILPSGEIKYAIPYHQEALIQYEAKRRNMTRDEFLSNVKWTFTDELIEMTGIVLIWYDHFIAPKNITEEQLKSIDLLSNKNAISFSVIDVLTQKGYQYDKVTG